MKSWVRRLCALGAALALLIIGVPRPSLAQTAEPPVVVASIAPVHSLAARVMRGVGEPVLLTPPGVSPHAYALKPSQARALSSASVVAWIGPDLELWLARPLETLGENAALLTLSETSPVQLETRVSADWSDAGDHDDHDEHGHDDHGHDHDHGDTDPHLWLDPANAAAWIAAIAAKLAEIDPANATVYQANAAEAHAELTALTAELEADLAPARGARYVVFHDAYQYFERRFDLPAHAAVAVNPEIGPGGAWVSQLNAKIREEQVACVFTEPQFTPRLAEALVEGSGAKLGVLDPLGASTDPGEALYPAMLRGMAVALRDCLTN